jgi:MFS family permease
MRSPLAMIAALGVTQIIGYGSLYYAFPIMAPAVAQEFGVSEPLLFGLLSAGLLLGGLAAPRLGGLLDRMGAPRVMAAGSLLMAGLSAALALAPSLPVYGALLLLIELLSFTVLYDAAFATLAQRQPQDTRRAITRLTLIAGFASTLFWPLTGWLVDHLGWRGAQGIFAALHLGIAVPLHLALAARPRRQAAPQPVVTPPLSLPPPLTGAAARQAFVLLGLSFALTGMAISALGVHLVPVLLARGLGETAYLAAMVMGPAQVLIRLVDATLWRHLHPLQVAVVSAAAIPVALALLLVPGPAALLAFAFALCFGAGQGLSSIVRGSVPVALFGVTGLGQRLGRLAAIRSVLGASAPFLFAWAMAQLGAQAAICAALAVALAGVLALVMLRRQIDRAGALSVSA